MKPIEMYLIYTMYITVISSVDDDILEGKEYLLINFKKLHDKFFRPKSVTKKDVLKSNGCKVKLYLLTPATGTIEEGSPS